MLTVGIDLDLHGVLLRECDGFNAGRWQPVPSASRHLLGRNDQDPAAHLFDQLAQIVEQVIDLRMTQVSEFDLTRRTVQPSGNLAVGLDQQRRDPPGGGRLGNLLQVITAKPLGFRPANSSLSVANRA
jgi:hypothetical protein